MNNKQIKEKILADIAEAQKEGYTLIMEDWGSYVSKCACPLGCVNVVAGNRPDSEEDGGVSRILDVDQTWINSFIDGYDDNGSAKGATNPIAWKMGAEIRSETNPITYGQFVDKMDSL